MYGNTKGSRKKTLCILGGIVAEKISTYKMQAEPSFFGQSMVTMRLKIETTDEMTHTYILKFADKDVKIVNGKVVE